MSDAGRELGQPRISPPGRKRDLPWPPWKIVIVPVFDSLLDGELAQPTQGRVFNEDRQVRGNSGMCQPVCLVAHHYRYEVRVLAGSPYEPRDDGVNQRVGFDCSHAAMARRSASAKQGRRSRLPLGG